MAQSGYITKKVPRHLAPWIRRLKARMEMTGEKVTEGEVLALALQKLDEDLAKAKRYTLMDLAGAIKGGKKSRADEIDKIVYGI